MVTKERDGTMKKPLFEASFVSCGFKVNVRIRYSGKPIRKSRVFFFVSGETVLENLQTRYHRPTVLYRRMLPEILRRAGFNPTQTAKWRQTCGCSCGCSPGFVLSEWKDEYIVVTLLPI